VVLALGFVLAVSANPHTNTASALVLAALVCAVGFFAAQRVTASRSAVVAGAAAALAALWLVGQRDDVAAVVVLAVLLGAGIRPLDRVHPRVAIGACAVAPVAARFAGTSQEAVLFATAGAVVLCAALRLRAVTEGTHLTRWYIAALVGAVALVTAYIGAETPSASWFGGGIAHGPTNRPQIALTFDDGPNIGATVQIMAILDRAGVKGTFFEVGKAIDADPQITRALYDDGQLVGNHSYHHDQWRWLDPRYPELQRTQNAFRRAIGVCPALYRPPHGERTPFLARVVHDHHMHMVLWNASAGDWATNDAALVARRIVAGAKPGGILLLHDGLDGNPRANRQVLVRALPMIITGLERKGLTPVRLDQLLGVAPYTSCS
jgi:peptidoglycan/xylan/chitin deacetylase (PgdA/CDA1 family)